MSSEHAIPPEKTIVSKPKRFGQQLHRDRQFGGSFIGLIANTVGNWSERSAKVLRVVVSVCVIGSTLVLAVPAGADGADTIYQSGNGCWHVERHGAGMVGGNPGKVTIGAGVPANAVLHDAFIEWVGSDDLTPQEVESTPISRADSTLTLTSSALDAPVEVAGVQAEGEAGYSTFTSDSWYGWSADIGPNGSDVIRNQTSEQAITVTGWDVAPGGHSNGITFTIIWQLPSCETPSAIILQTGVDYYYHRDPMVGGTTGVVVYQFSPSASDRVAAVSFSHAGTDSSSVSCRGNAMWILAGAGEAPTVADAGFTLVDVGQSDQPGRGVNGAVEVARDVFAAKDQDCKTTLNPTPLVSYESGHPFPNGGASAPYGAVVPSDSNDSLTEVSGTETIAPADSQGKQADNEAEWAVNSLDVRIPAGTEWVALQLESEADQNGESGSWAGPELRFPAPTLAPVDPPPPAEVETPPTSTPPVEVETPPTSTPLVEVKDPPPPVEVETPSITVPSTTPPTSTPGNPTPELAVTGSYTTMQIVIGVGAVLLGVGAVGAVWLARRRPDESMQTS